MRSIKTWWKQRNIFRGCYYNLPVPDVVLHPPRVSFASSGPDESLIPSFDDDVRMGFDVR